jgi:Beta-lactamase
LKTFTYILKRIWNYTWKFFLLFLIVSNLYILITGNFYLYRAVYYSILHGQISPGIFDKDYFYSREIKGNTAQPWPVSAHYNKHTIPKSERDQLEALNTTSYLVYEEYFDGFGQKEISNSFSMAKSVVGLLIGIAKNEGKIKSIDDPVSDYLPNYDKGNRKKITIRHLLTMSADLVWNESAWNPLSHNAEAYYGTDLKEMMDIVDYGAAPGKVFDYKSGSTQVLGMIVMKVQENYGKRSEPKIKRIGVLIMRTELKKRIAVCMQPRVTMPDWENL